MTIKPEKLILLAICAVLAGAGIWWYAHRTTETAVQSEAETVSALVKIEKIEQQAIDTSLLAFGEVFNAKIDTLNFAQAGQLTTLLVQPGQQVKKGVTLATLSIDPTAYSGWQQAVSAVNFAQAELKREEELFGLKLLTQTQLDTAQKQLIDARSILAAQKKLGTESGTPSLIAPMDGVVTALLAAQGDRLAAGSGVVQVGESDKLRIVLGIEPSMLHLIKAGMKVTLASIQNPNQTVAARLSEVQRIVDPKTQLVNAIVLLAPQAMLVPGMRVQGTVQLGQKLAWLAPREAVLTDEKGAYIFQVENGKARRVEVTKVAETATHFGIEGEINPKLALVVQGNYELEDGMAVRERAK